MRAIATSSARRVRIVPGAPAGYACRQGYGGLGETQRVTREPELRSAAAVFVALLEAMVDRGADVLERLGAELAEVSKTVFRGGPSRPGRLAGANVALHRALITVGTTGDRLALARDTLLGIGRIAPFEPSLRKSWIVPEFAAKLDAVAKDIASPEQATSPTRVQFLLDAILGLITIQQNDVFKVRSHRASENFICAILPRFLRGHDRPGRTVPMDRSRRWGLC